MFGILKLIFSLISPLYALTFGEAIESLDQHKLIQVETELINTLKSEGDIASSWGDPKLSVSAVNFPKDSLDWDNSMMTGLKLGLSQKLTLSGRNRLEKEAFLELAASQSAKRELLKRKIVKSLWIIEVENQRAFNALSVLRESKRWLESNLKVSKRLYSTGKVPQQAVLEIQIALSKLNVELASLRFKLKSYPEMRASLLSRERPMQITDIPWDHLERWQSLEAKYDFFEKGLEKKLKAEDLQYQARKRDYFPDIEFGVHYTKRNNAFGDFVGASITIPIPTSSTRYSKSAKKLSESKVAKKRLEEYRLGLPHLLRKIEFEIHDHIEQLRIRENEILKYAKSSRDIVAKSYSRGGASYKELLDSHLQYQNEKFGVIKARASLLSKKINYIFTKGSALYPEKENRND